MSGDLLTAMIVTIGDELLIGQIVNTNASWLGDQLDAIGITVGVHLTVGDDLSVIDAALTDALRRYAIVIVTGGLGPTQDDVTRDALAKCFSVSVHEDKVVTATIAGRFKKWGLRMPASNVRQALVPEGFEVLPNPVGTAPGLWNDWHENGSFHCLVALPGVPFEMRRLMQEHVLPRIMRQTGRRCIVHLTLHTTGIGESHLQECLGNIPELVGSQVHLASLPGISGVSLRLSASGTDATSVTSSLLQAEMRFHERIGRYIYGSDMETLESVVGQLLLEENLTLAMAESCTAGAVCHRLTNVSGSSAYVRGGIIAYSNDIKVDVLGVIRSSIEDHGAVSEEVVRQMAEGARGRLGADVGLATSGIMGPDGGTESKPVGTVWLGYADAYGAHAKMVHVGHDRITNKERAAAAALAMLWRRLSLRRETNYTEMKSS